MKKPGQARINRSHHIQAEHLHEEMQSFMKELRSFAIDFEEVNGKKKEYVTLAQAKLLYKKHFGKEAMVDSTLSYRIRQLDKSQTYPDDLCCINGPINDAFTTKVFINRTNTVLLEAIFLPVIPIPKELRDAHRPMKDLNAFFTADPPDEDDDY